MRFNIFESQLIGPNCSDQNSGIAVTDHDHCRQSSVVIVINDHWLKLISGFGISSHCPFCSVRLVIRVIIDRCRHWSLSHRCHHSLLVFVINGHGYKLSLFIVNFFAGHSLSRLIQMKKSKFEHFHVSPSSVFPTRWVCWICCLQVTPNDIHTECQKYELEGNDHFKLLTAREKEIVAFMDALYPTQKGDPESTMDLCHIWTLSVEFASCMFLKLIIVRQQCPVPISMTVWFFCSTSQCFLSRDRVSQIF